MQTMLRAMATTLLAALTLCSNALAGNLAAERGVTADQNFVNAAAETNATGIEAAKLVLRKSADPDVRRYAQLMIADHSRLQAELRKLAKASGVPMLAPKANPSVLAELRSAPRDRLAYKYLDLVALKAHMQAVELYTRESEQGRVPAIQSWATRNLPMIKTHLEMANRLSSDKANEP